jgi:uncharacterized protein (TIGR02270 family)
MTSFARLPAAGPIVSDGAAAFRAVTMPFEARLAAGPSVRGFTIGLYLEHLEEASFLYEQRLWLLDDVDVAWPEVADFEDRLEAHLDALVLGNELAIEVCRQQAERGDFGELYAALVVFCRHRRLELVRQVIDRIESSDADRVRAAATALSHELPVEWHSYVTYLAGSTNSTHRRVAVEVIDRRRLPAVFELLRGLELSDGSELPAVIRALGRVADRTVAWRLRDLYVKHSDETIRAAIALALLRLGEGDLLNVVMKRAFSPRSRLIAVGLGQHADGVTELLRLAGIGGATRDNLLMMGVIGDIRAVETLIGLLATDNLGETAATALYLITGARLGAASLLRETVCADELFQDERDGRADEQSVDGAPTLKARSITRLSRQSVEWNAWWIANASRFRPGVRYRLGRPYSLMLAVHTLAAGALPRQVRELAYEELVIRHNAAFAFETDMFVERQKDALSVAEGWAATMGAPPVNADRTPA